MSLIDEDEDPLLDDLAAIKPHQTDMFAAALRARVRRSLVGASEPFRLGRFTVLEPLGSGGMGAVFVAYDPDLDRKIALKVLHNRGERGRREMLREGRALARLRHANVVGVYEVGVVEDDVFVAMEYVEGQNLRGWLKTPRTPAEVLARMVEAGRGLAAAHAVDLVHHDFKPENLVIDATGTARVVDFGMAQLLADLQTTGRPVTDALATTVSVHGGTPVYMAPERLAGAAGDRASDQYSWCVTCWEALFGARPEGERPEPRAGARVPGWVRRVVERGLAREPGRRWPSMAALLAALERGQRWVRIRRVAVGVAVVAAIAGAAEVWRRVDMAARTTACAGRGEALAAVWNDEGRARLRAGFSATGVSYAASTVDRVLPRIDAYAAAWAAARTDACMRVDVAGQWTADTAARSEACLEDRRAELDELVREFARADATAVRRAVPAMSGLRPPAACLDEAALLRVPTAPAGAEAAQQAVRAELSRVQSLGLAGHFPAALAAATSARTQADGALRASPLWAVARAQEGIYLEETAKYPEAETASAEAYFAAARVGAWDTAAEAATRLIGIVGQHQSRHAEGRVWARHAEVAAAYAADDRGLLEARRLSRLAILEHTSGALDTARALTERMVALWEAAVGPGHPDMALALNSLGLVHYDLGGYPEARALFERALKIWEETLGPDHPSIAMALSNMANVALATGAFAEAETLLERALKIAEAALGPDHTTVAGMLGNLGAVYASTGKRAEARAVFERVLAVHEKTLGPDHPETANMLVNLATVDHELGAYAEARARAERALPILEKALGAEHPSIANCLLVLADVQRDAGALAAARPLYARALAIEEKTMGPDHPLLATALVHLGELHLRAGHPREALPLLTRAVKIVADTAGVQEAEHTAHFTLARALLATGERARAFDEARAARDGMRAQGMDGAPELAEVERWLGERAAE